MIAERYTTDYRRGITIACAGVLSVLVVYVLGLDPLLRWLLFLPTAIRVIIALIILAPLSCFMGFCFPLGLQSIADRMPSLVGWAWGINGATSVAAIVLATILSINFGFRFVIMCVAILYILAYFMFPAKWIGEQNQEINADVDSS